MQGNLQKNTSVSLYRHKFDGKRVLVRSKNGGDNNYPVEICDGYNSSKGTVCYNGVYLVKKNGKLIKSIESFIDLSEDLIIVEIK
jgi:hypothetical protein